MSDLRIHRSKLAFVLFLGLLCQLFLYPPKNIHADGEAAASAAAREIYEQLKANRRVPGPQPEYAETDKPTVYLTFDDGPSKLTPQVLDILRENGIHATFFVLGEEAEAYPDVIKRIVAEGHELGNHTYDHVYKELYSSFSTFWEQVQKTEQILDGIAGVKPRLIRAPGGTYTNFDAFYYYYLEQAGYTIVDWNIDSGDSKRAGVPASEIVSTVKKGPFPHDIVLLLHDGSGHAESVKALPEIIRFFKAKGYDFAPLTEQVKPVQFRLGALKWNRAESFADFEQRVAQAGSYKTARDNSWEERMERELANQARVAAAESTYALERMNHPPLTLVVKAGGANLSAAVVAGAAGKATGPSGEPGGRTGKPSAQAGEPSGQAAWPSGPSGGQAAEPARPGEAAQPGKAAQPADAARAGSSAARESDENRRIVFQTGEYDFRNGRFYVPLRGLIEQLGGSVSWNGATMEATVHYGYTEAQYDMAEHAIRLSVPGKPRQTIHFAEMELKDGSIVVPLRSTLEMLGDSITGYKIDDAVREVALVSRGGIPLVLSQFSALFPPTP